MTVLSKKNCTTGWPSVAQGPLHDAESDKLTYACSILECLTPRPLNYELQCLGGLLDAAMKRAPVMAIIKHKKIESPKQLDNASHKIKLYLEAFTKLLGSALANGKIHTLIAHGEGVMSNGVKHVFKVSISRFRELTKECKLMMDGGVLDVKTLFAPEFKKEEAWAKISSKEAAAFRTAWSSLVNFNEALDGFREYLNVPRYSYLAQSFDEDTITVDEGYSACRRCLCDLFAIRALARNESHTEPRKTMVEHARNVIAQIAGYSAR